MSRLDELPPDQQAALSLLLRRRKSYAEVAALLGIPERAVHDRAHAALAMLAPREARELTAERRAEVGDYLLGQRADRGERAATHTYLERSAPARAWATAVAAELGALADGKLAEIPEVTEIADVTEMPDSTSPASPASPQSSTPLPSSRLGGAILLAAIVAGVIVAVILLMDGGSGTPKASSAGTASATSSAPGGKSLGTGQTGASAGHATEDRRIALTPRDPASKALGVAEVLSEGKTYAYYLAAEHVPPSTGFFYAVWLYNSPSSFEALNKAPAVTASGHLQGGSLLPPDAGKYHTMLLTRETSAQPTSPGPIVLSGAFGLH